MSNDDKKLDEVKETITEEPIEDNTVEEKAESEDDMQTSSESESENENESEDTTDIISEKEIDNNVDVKDKKVKISLIIGIIIFLLIIGGVLYWWISNKKLVDSYENKVYPEVYVYSEPVGELNEVDLSKVLVEKDAEIANKSIKVNVNGQEYSSSYAALNVTTNKDEVEDEIMQYGKNKSFKGKLDLINKPEKKTYDLKTIVNEDAIKEFVAQIAEDVKVMPVNASAEIYGGVVSIVEGQNGYVLDEQALVDSITSQITGENGGSDIVVDGTLVESEPQITANQLRSIDTRISSFTTYFSAGNSGHNIQVGSSYFNNTLLMPGEEFSCTDGIGPTTADRGFVSSNTYVGGQVVPGMGGGVCQIATTLYNAELRAGILPTERQNHMMTVGYVGIGLDATLADDLIDLRFVNPYDYPLIITTSATSGSLTIEIWSNSNAMNGYTYQPRVEAVSSLNCYTYLDKYDSSGKLVDSIYLNQSVYQPFS
ncbi:MAG: VanW family protein [Clostridium sp.]|nr:VanW family protein [Clostridium sp.]